MSFAVLTKDERCACYYNPSTGSFISEDPIGGNSGILVGGSLSGLLGTLDVQNLCRG